MTVDRRQQTENEASPGHGKLPRCDLVACDGSCTIRYPMSEHGKLPIVWQLCPTRPSVRNQIMHIVFILIEERRAKTQPTARARAKKGPRKSHLLEILNKTGHTVLKNCSIS